MLQIILGRSGSGKTYKIRNILKGLLEANSKVMLIVPEQDSFRNERDILRELGPQIFSKLEVFSFKRLSEHIFNKIGGLIGDRISDSGRNVLMSLAIDQVKDHLNIYKKHFNKVEMIEIMVSALKEFKTCSIGIEDLNNIAKEVDNKILKCKMEETSLILGAYNALISDRYIDPLDNLSKLDDKLNENKFFRNYTVVIDGFSGFTPQEIKILDHIFEQANDCYITFCSDQLFNKDNEIMLFSSVYKSIKRVLRTAKKRGLSIKKPLFLEEAPRFHNKSLKIIEEEIFRMSPKSYDIIPKDITIYNATNLYDESEFVCNNIKKLVAEENYKYKDFVVVSRVTDTYKGIIETVFKKNEIPYFMDNLENIGEKTLMNLVISAFEIINNNYDSDAIFRYLKTGLVGMKADEIFMLENYILLWNISGRDWHKEFLFNPNGFSETFKDEDKDKLALLNRLRNKLMKPLINFENNIKNVVNGEDFAKYTYLLLEEIEIQNNIKNMYKNLVDSGEELLADEQIRLWDLLMGILEQMSLVLKGYKLTAYKFAELLELVINSSEIAFIPQGIDEVTIADADRSRMDSPKVVFVIGAVEGEFPRTPVTTGAFTDVERKVLLGKGLQMYECLEKLIIEEKFIAYTALTAASEKLYVTWPSKGLSGSSKYPSTIVKSIKKIFPNIVIKDEFCIDDEDKIWSEKSAFEMCAKYWNDNSVFSVTLKKYFYDNDNYKNVMNILDSPLTNKNLSIKNSENIKKLFGENMRLSASQIEKYYLCRFQYFCTYGLKAKERRPAVFGSLEYGSLMHFIMENVLSEHSMEEISRLDDRYLSEKVKEILENYIEIKMGGWEGKTYRFRYLFYRLIDTACILIKHMSKEFLQSDFIPNDYELDISAYGEIQPLSIKLPNGNVVEVQGKVDRVDVMKKDNVSYIRVIDYKTGSKEFRLSDVIYGLNIQMLIYLAAICKNGGRKYGNIIPAGILYMPVTKPIVNGERGIEDDDLDKKKERKLRMNGLILDDDNVIYGMEKEARGVFIPVTVKNGQISKRDSIASLAQMGKIFKYIEDLIISMADDLYNGEISAKPASGEYDACAWCPYKSVCGHEDGDENLVIEKYDRDEALKILCEEEVNDNV